MTDTNFYLPNDLLATYRNKTPDWGYRDAYGTAVGEVVFLRTYSRMKDDGTKETWFDVCKRVIEGMFTLQKRHCIQNRLPWDELKAHIMAKDAFVRMFEFKWTPPGRGLWTMGTPLVMEQNNSAALQNCFGGETRFLTEDGVRTLGETVGEDVRVRTRNGWTDATVEHFGMQKVQRVTFAPFGRRSNHRVYETVTPDHRWELRDGTLTTNLQVGDVVPALAGGDFDEREVALGFKHGLFFADGSISYTYVNGDFSHMMRLCGDKAKYRDLFEKHHYQPNCNGDPVVYERSSTNMKRVPDGDKSPSYIAGFIKGWLEFDGNGTTIDTQDGAAADWLIANAALAGYMVVGDNSWDGDTNFGKRSAPLRRIRLNASPDYWTVKSIEPLDEEVPVYCAVVPGEERFTLASGVYTSNCAFVSTKVVDDNLSKPFRFLMEASMLGIGVGFDTEMAKSEVFIHEPDPRRWTHVIPDTREGWVESVGMVLDAFLYGVSLPNFDYSLIRPAGEPIKTFGGTAAGPQPLIDLHNGLIEILSAKIGEKIDSRTVADIGNLIGVCVVSGNVRRSAELLLGDVEDEDFLALKDYEKNPERMAHGWMSNNSVRAERGTDLSGIVEGIVRNGEPGVVWMDTSREYGRLADPVNNKDWRISGYNPCAEQSLESYECCTLTECFMDRHDDMDDFLETLKVAYLYAKTVTLIPTHWPETNAVMQRNRRIGASVSGVTNFADKHGLPTLRSWLDAGYQAVQDRDRKYSEWLGVRESIKTTSVKPSGTVSLLAGSSPGAHWPVGGRHHIRRVTFSAEDPMVQPFRDAGYVVEDSIYSKGTVVVEFPVESRAIRSEKDVSAWEKATMAGELQRYWADNSVSVTVSFDPENEAQHIAPILHWAAGNMKTISFLPMGNQVYGQMPYENLDTTEWTKRLAQEVFPVDLSGAYGGKAKDAEGESFCTTDACEIRSLT